MSEPAARLAMPLRVAIEATSAARREWLRAVVESSGHVVAAAPANADVILADGAHAADGVVPAVCLGSGEGAGVLPQDADAVQIDAALRAVAAGLHVRAAEAGFGAIADTGPVALLTPREVEVLSAIALGLGNKEIARRLEISLHTVKFHIEAIFRKLGVRSRAEAVARGLQRLEL
jgi:DNA-binding NarL/FixJ family response regulator